MGIWAYATNSGPPGRGIASGGAADSVAAAALVLAPGPRSARTPSTPSRSSMSIARQTIGSLSELRAVTVN
jgi:hypothetical protein